MTENLIPPDGIVDVANRMRYPVAASHQAFEMAANILRNRVRELECELERYRHAIQIMDDCRLALFHARSGDHDD